MSNLARSWVRRIDFTRPADTTQYSVGDAVSDNATTPTAATFVLTGLSIAPNSGGMIDSVTLADGFPLAVPGVVPKLSRTPGAHRRNAPALGQDSDAVLREIGLTEAQISALRERGIVAG